MEQITEYLDVSSPVKFDSQYGIVTNMDWLYLERDRISFPTILEPKHPGSYWKALFVV